MAGVSGPTIPGVTDQLVAYFDAALTYQDGSTLWNNKFGGTSFSLNNGPTYSNGKESSIIFDGSDDNASIANADLSYNRNNFSIDIWVNYPTAHSGWSGATICKWSSGAGNSNEWVLGARDQTGPSLFGFTVQSPQNSGGDNTRGAFFTTSSFNYSINTWYNLCGVFDGPNTSAALYVNGVLEQSISNFNDSSVKNNGNIWRLADLTTPNYSTNIKIASLKIYNKALLSAEVLQNYNALKSRFNL